VLKTPSVNYEDDPVYLEMFTREEWIGNLVTSPHVLKVIRPERVRKSLYYVTEFFEGQTLRQWMVDHPKVDLEMARVIIEQIAKGLRAFHRKEIIHQDLKPENILIDASSSLKIIDFGSSRVAGLSEVADGRERPALVGTLDYTAPEYHLGETPTNRSDIYSLGVIAYELLTGKLPYGKGFAGRRDLARHEYIPAATLNEGVPAWVDAALAKAVHKSAAHGGAVRAGRGLAAAQSRLCQRPAAAAARTQSGRVLARRRNRAADRQPRSALSSQPVITPHRLSR
jgi:serine/threonine protein kinase